MDPENSAISRVERTLWTVWNFLTGAVNRFLHPEPIPPEGNEHDASQESAVDPEGESGGQGADEERPLDATSPLRLSRPVVAWEQEEVVQLSEASESRASEEREDTGEEPLGQTGSDGAAVFEVAKEDEEEEEEDGDQKSYTHRQDDTTEHEGPLNVTDDDKSENQNRSDAAGDHRAIDGEILTERVACNEVVQRAEAELQTADFKEKEDVVEDTEERTTMPENDGVIGEQPNETTTHVSVFDQDQTTAVESLSSGAEDDKESHMVAACTTTSLAVKPKAQTGQEIHGAFENIPLALWEGRAVVLEEPHSPTSEGKQEGVPEYDNEPGPDENTTQRFLEAGNYKEINTTPLPEEVESGTGGGFSPEDIKKEGTTTSQFTDAGLPEEAEKKILEPAIEGSRDKEETGVWQFDKAPETIVGATDEETEELLVDFETDEGLHGNKDEMTSAAADETLKFIKAEERRMTEISFYRASGDAEPNRIKSLGLDDVIQSTFMKEADTSTFPEGSSEEAVDAGIDMEETGSGVEEQEIEDEAQNKSTTGTLTLAAELMSEHHEDIWFTQSELSGTDEPLERTNPPPSSVPECQERIDEEILDLWIETASFKEAQDIGQQEGPDETEEELPSEEGKEQVVESMSGESGLVSDTETFPSESGLLDQSVSEWSTDQSESHLPESTSSGSLQDFCHLLAGASESAVASELSTQQPDSECQDALLAEAAEMGTSDFEEEESTAETEVLPGSGVTLLEAGCLKVRPEESQDKTDEEQVESGETGKQKESDSTDSGEEDLDILYTDEKSEDAAREASDSLDETEPTELEDVTCAEKLDTTWSEDGAEETEGQTNAQVESSSALDFTAQRSRIAVKNPRVRPPKDPRSLLHMPSVDPVPSTRPPVKVPAGVPFGGMGIGIKLPGFGAGFPVLKKTQRGMAEDKSPEAFSEEPEIKPKDKSDTIKQDEERHKPKWMPPQHPGFGNPLMSELKNKLKKPTNE